VLHDVPPEDESATNETVVLRSKRSAKIKSKATAVHGILLEIATEIEKLK